MNILVGIDFSDRTKTIVEEAKKLATALSAKVWLVYVAEPEPDFVGFDVGPQYERDAQSEKYRQEHSDLQSLAEDLRKEGLDVTALLIQGYTAEKILSEAAKLDAGMIIVGSHGKGAMQRLLVGSVSEGVLRGAECPVLVVPTREAA